MARSRTIKPGFFTSEQVASCSPLARLLFAGLWTIVDRAGKCLDKPRQIKASLLPYEPIPDAAPLLDELHSAGLILRYEVDGERYLKVVNFEKHQNPHPKEVASELPEPDLSVAGSNLSAASREKISISRASSNPSSSNPSSPATAAAVEPRPAESRLPGIASRVGEQLGQARLGLGDPARRAELETSIGRVVDLVGEDDAVLALTQIAREHLGGQVSALTAFIGWIDRIPDREWRRAGGLQ